MTIPPTSRACLVTDRLESGARDAEDAGPASVAGRRPRTNPPDPSGETCSGLARLLHLSAVSDERVDDKEVNREQRDRPDRERRGPGEVHQRTDRNEDDTQHPGPHPTREEAQAGKEDERTGDELHPTP